MLNSVLFGSYVISCGAIIRNFVKMKQQDGVALDKSVTNLGSIKVDEAEVNAESRVGKTLNDFTQKRVIILVLSMLFSVPIMSTSAKILNAQCTTLSMTWAGR